jgi:hypothetical protein
MYEARKWGPGHLKEDISNTARPRGGDLKVLTLFDCQL